MIAHGPRKVFSRQTPGYNEAMSSTIKIVLSLLFIGILAIAGVTYTIVRPALLELQDTSSFQNPELSTRILDRYGHEIAVLGAKKRVWIALKDIPEPVKQAFLCAEDREFYNHAGISLKSLVRAAWVNLWSGHVSQGGSTITQQLARTLFLDSDKTMVRKVKEAVLALYLEHKYSKDEILEQYLNMVYFGNNAYGVVGASRVYFNKSVRKLSIPEAAMLAGLLQAPSRYAPHKHYARAKRRQEIVLERMQAAGVIPESQLKALRRIPVKVVPGDHGGLDAVGYAIDAVQEEAQRLLDNKKITATGLVIRTTLDSQLLDETHNALSRHLAEPEKNSAQFHREAALLTIDPRDGSILAMHGGIDYKRSQFNRAFSTRRPVGDLSKPILLALALEKGLELHSSYRLGNDQDGKSPAADLSADAIYRIMFDREPFVSAGLMANLGIGTFRKFSQSLGVDFREQDMSLAVGQGMSTLKSMSQAFAGFVNGGIKYDPHFILSIHEPSGKLIYRYGVQQKNKVMDDAVAYMVFDSIKRSKSVQTSAQAGGRVPADASSNRTTYYAVNEDGRDMWSMDLAADRMTSVWVGAEDGRSKAFASINDGERLLHSIALALTGTEKASNQVAQVHIPSRIQMRRFRDPEGREGQNVIYLPGRLNQRTQRF